MGALRPARVGTLEPRVERLEFAIATSLTLADLARAPRWPQARLDALAGRCRGALLRDWAANIERRFGAAAVAAVREATALDLRTLPDAPSRHGWYPVAAQLALTRAVAERYLAGDLLALEPLLHEAGRGARDRVVEWAMATVGPGFVMRQAERLHRWLYDEGRAAAEVARDGARVVWGGAPFCGEPTWRVLQAFAVRSTVALLDREVVALEAEDLGPEAFALTVRWSARLR